VINQRLRRCDLHEVDVRLGHIGRCERFMLFSRPWIALPSGLPNWTVPLKRVPKGGLPVTGLIRTVLEVEQVLGVEVDLIRHEESGNSLRARILSEGEELHVPH
jgi:hypothetical protein